MKVIFSLIISIIILLGLVAGMFVFYVASSPNYEENDIQNPFIGENIIINETHVSYLINEMGAYNLKSYLGDTPKIEVEVDKEKFNSEIKEGIIITKRGEIENEDIKITTSKEEMINIALSNNPKQDIQNSVSSGKTVIELKAGYPKLFAKGYLNLYKEITGKSLTGSAIKIFSD